MNREINRLRQMFASRLQEAGGNIMYARVKSVNEKERTCTAVIEEIEYENILLYGIEKPELEGFVLIPRIDSMVLVSRVGEGRLFVVMFSEVDKVLLKIKPVTISCRKEEVKIEAESTLLQVTKKGLTLSRSGSGLKKTLGDLIDALTKLTVPTSVGPSGTPVNAADFMKIKEDLSNYLEG